MEVTTLNSDQLRERMREAGISQTAVAREAGMPSSDLSAIFNGRDYLGAKRRARIEAAIVRLGLDKARSPEGVPQQPTFNIRQL